ncbi:MAG: hypothetical protein ACJAVZ_004081 [Afipia broomeae]|jgi:hypothetical protein
MKRERSPQIGPFQTGSGGKNASAEIFLKPEEQHQSLLHLHSPTLGEAFTSHGEYDDINKLSYTQDDKWGNKISRFLKSPNATGAASERAARHVRIPLTDNRMSFRCGFGTRFLGRYKRLSLLAE